MTNQTILNTHKNTNDLPLQNFANTPHDQDTDKFGPNSDNQIDQAVEEQKEVLPESLVGK